MIKGLSRAGIGDVGNLEQFIAKAAQYGFAAVDADGKELRQWAEEKGLDEARAYLREQRVVIGSIGLAVEWRQDEDKFREGLGRLVQDAEIAAQFGCTACCTYVLPSTDYNAAHFMALATKRLKTCARILGAFGLRLGLEFVGPHHLRTRWKNPFIWDLPGTLDWIDAIGEPNVGLLFDAYHWYTTDGTMEDILQLRPEQIVHVHLNDARDVPIAEVLDNDRLFPGEGVIDLAAFLRALQQIGYRGVVAQEILTRTPFTEPADALLERSASGYRKVYAGAGLV